MSNTAIETRLREIFVAELGIDHSEITENLQYDGASEWDSVGHMHLIAAIEDEFSIEIPDTAIAEMTTFQQVLDTVLQLLGDE